MKKAHMFLVLLVIVIFVISTAFAENSLNGKSADGKLKKEKDIKISDNKVIEKEGRGKINFRNSFDIEVEEVDNSPNVYISDNLIAINTEELPELNQSATLTFYNLSFETTPVIYYNEEFTTRISKINEPCPQDICSNINYDSKTGTLSFDVAHFSSYYAGAWGGFYNPQFSSWGACNTNEDCKQTAFCAKYVDCEAADYQVLAGGYSFGPHELNLCSYKPAAGTESLTCTKSDRIWVEYNEPCPEGFESGWADSVWYNLRYCSKTESCSTCDGTKACERNYCASNSFMSCLSSNCPQNPISCWAWADCMKRASESCLTTSVNYGLPESHWCQPKTCGADDSELGECYYEGDDYNPEQKVQIGGKICADKEQWQVCVEGDGDPCGEFETLEEDETEITTTDMYGLDDFTVDVCAGNSPPAVSIGLKAKYSESTQPSVCEDILCRIEIRDECYVDKVEYTVTGGHGTLANSYPDGIIEGAADCIWDSETMACIVELTIPKQYTDYGDVISCSAKTKDSCEAETVSSRSIAIAPKCG